MPLTSRLNSLLVLFFDAVLVVFAAVWCVGGVPWGHRQLFSYSADIRRAAVLVGLLGIILSPRIRERSRIIRALRFVWCRIQEPEWRWFLFAVAALWSLMLGGMQALALRYPLWDVGLFHQVVWGVAHGHGYVSTVSGAGNFLLDHSSLSLALLTPFYWLTHDSPLILPIVHALLVFAGIAAWVYWAERVPGLTTSEQDQLAAATLVFALCFDSLWANLRWGFHENSLAFAGLSWGLVLLFLRVSDRDPDYSDRSSSARSVLIVFFLLVAAASKEILLLDVSVIFAIWALLEGRRHRGVARVCRVAPLLMAAVILSILFYAYESLPHPESKNYFSRYYAYLGRTLSEMLRNLVFEPGRVIAAIGWSSILGFLKTVFLPWLGLPLVATVFAIRRGSRGLYGLFFLALLPSFASALLSTYEPLRQSGFHYVLELWPILALLTIIALAQLSYRTRRFLLMAWLVVAVFTLRQDPWRQAFDYTREAGAREPVRRALEAIPLGDSVVASDLAGAWVSGRLRVARWPDLDWFPSRCPDWIVLQGDKTTPSLRGIGCDQRYEKQWELADWAAYRRSGKTQ